MQFFLKLHHFYQSLNYCAILLIEIIAYILHNYAVFMKVGEWCSAVISMIMNEITTCCCSIIVRYLLK